MRLDERFLLHRFKATSHAAVVGGFLMGGWLGFEYFAHDRFHWDIAIIGAAMAVTKLVALLYYRMRD